MSLTTHLNRETFVGNGSRKVFPFHFKVWAADQVSVYTKDGNTDKDITELAVININRDYDDANAADGNAGTVTFQTAPAKGQRIVLYRHMPYVQEDVYVNGSRFDPHEVEDRLDQDCAERQELFDGVSRALKVPITSSQDPDELMAEIFDLRDYATQCRNDACACASEAEEILEEIKEASALAHLANSLSCAEQTWTLGTDIPRNGVIAVPDIAYIGGRHMVRMSYDGIMAYHGTHWVECTDAGSSAWVYGKQTSSFKTLIPLPAGTVINIWVSSLNGSASALERAEHALEGIDDLKNAAVTSASQAVAAAESTQAAYDLFQEAAFGNDGSVRQAASYATQAQGWAIYAESAATKALYYKGVVSSLSALPSGASAGDMYIVGSTGYIWNGTSWDNIGTVVMGDDQQVDAEPTSGSLNAVASGGVYSELTSVRASVSAEETRAKAAEQAVSSAIATKATQLDGKLQWTVDDGIVELRRSDQAGSYRVSIAHQPSGGGTVLTPLWSPDIDGLKGEHIVDSQSGYNSGFIKYASGFQICWGYMSGIVSTTNGTGVTVASGFRAGYWHAFVMPTGSVQCYVSVPSSNSSTFRVNTNSSSATDIRYFCMGSWK